MKNFFVLNKERNSTCFKSSLKKKSKIVKQLKFISLGAFSILGIFFGLNRTNAQNLSTIEKSSLYPFKIQIISKTTVFNAGDDWINSYRIPSLVTTKKGSLLLFCEARKLSWKDKSTTEIVFKRSTDNGRVWSKMKVIASDGNNAFMDPCAIVDKQTGKIFLFTTLWPENDHSGLVNTAWIMISDDDGLSWSAPLNITREIVSLDNYIGGFGPGSGLQMKGGKFNNRLILPTRQIGVDRKVKNRVVYSDDHGVTWQVGNEAEEGGEFQIAESPIGTLIYNRRNGVHRMSAKSIDGGLTWSTEKVDTSLISVSGGCQGSVLGIGNTLFYTGPAGCNITDTTDNRASLTIYKSSNGGITWQKKYLLYDKASGYSCITILKDGRLAIAFETANTKGFSKIRGSRTAGWMRLDVMVLSIDISKSG